jgi:hypothetical protein
MIVPEFHYPLYFSPFPNKNPKPQETLQQPRPALVIERGEGRDDQGSVRWLKSAAGLRRLFADDGADGSRWDPAPRQAH